MIRSVRSRPERAQQRSSAIGELEGHDRPSVKVGLEPFRRQQLHRLEGHEQRIRVLQIEPNQKGTRRRLLQDSCETLRHVGVEGGSSHGAQYTTSRKFPRPPQNEDDC